MVAAVVVVAGVIGISGIYPQIIDSEWVQNAGTHAYRTAVAEARPTSGSGFVTAIPLSPRRAATTTGEAAASAPRVVPPAPGTAEPAKVRTSVAAVELSANETAPPPADIPDAQTIADPTTEPAPTATPVIKPAERDVARAPVVKKRVVRNRGYSGAYAQYGGGRGGWSGWPGMGSPYHF